MRTNFYKLAFCFFLLLTISINFGCDGGGGGDDSDPNKVYRLYPVGYFEPGYRESFSGTGNDNYGNEYQGSFYFKTMNKTVIADQVVTPIQLSFNLKNTVTGAFGTAIVTEYYDDNKNPIRMVRDDGVIYTPLSIANIPKTGIVGDFGALTSWSSTDGNSMSGTWVLEKGSGRYAELVTMITVKDYLNYIMFYQELIEEIDENGYTNSITMTIYYPYLNGLTDLTINLSADRNS